MILYNIEFKNGQKLQEYGNSVADVQGFLSRSYSHFGEVLSIMPFS